MRPSALETIFWVTTSTSPSSMAMSVLARCGDDHRGEIVAGVYFGDPGEADDADFAHESISSR